MNCASLRFGARLTSVGDKITSVAPAASDAYDEHRVMTHEGVPVPRLELPYVTHFALH